MVCAVRLAAKEKILYHQAKDLNLFLVFAPFANRVTLFRAESDRDYQLLYERTATKIHSVSVNVNEIQRITDDLDKGTRVADGRQIADRLYVFVQ